MKARKVIAIFATITITVAIIITLIIVFPKLTNSSKSETKHTDSKSDSDTNKDKGADSNTDTARNKSGIVSCSCKYNVGGVKGTYTACREVTPARPCDGYCVKCKKDSQGALTYYSRM